MHSRLLRAVTIAVFLVPAVAIAITTAVWLPVLPASIPVQWSSGGVSATAPTVVVAAGLGATIALASIIGVATVRGARTRSQLADSRRAAAGCGTVAGAAAAVWITVAALSLGGAPVSLSDVGGWPLLALAAGLAWGALPALLLTVVGRLERSTA